MSPVAELLPPLTRSSPTLGLDVPLSIPFDTGDQFRQALPEKLKTILAGLRDLVETNIYSTLLAENEQVQRLAVASAFHAFRNYYCGMAFAVAANLGHDREHLAQLLRGSFAEAAALLREKGSRKLAADAVAVALHGLQTTARVASALRYLASERRDPSPDIIRDVIDNWIAYMMCFGALAHALEVGGQPTSREAAERLAFWSRGYAVTAYSALAPLLPTSPRPPGAGPQATVLDVEDEALLLTAEHDLVRRLDRDNTTDADS